MKIRALDVSEANSYIKRILINDPILCNLKIKGEISNLNKHYTGHYYFTLKDEHSRINAIMFANKARHINFDLKDGDKVYIEYIDEYFNKECINKKYI